METAEKISRAYQSRKERLVRQQAQPRNQNKLMSFKQYLRRKNKLGEAIIGSEAVGSFLCWLPSAADDTEKAITASQIAAAVIQLATAGDVTVTAVSVSPE